MASTMKIHVEVIEDAADDDGAGGDSWLMIGLLIAIGVVIALVTTAMIVCYCMVSSSTNHR